MNLDSLRLDIRYSDAGIASDLVHKYMATDYAYLV